MIETLHYDSIDSTNTEARRIINGQTTEGQTTEGQVTEGQVTERQITQELEAKGHVADGHKLDAPLLLVADSQTLGRGRCGRSFYSPACTGLYMTVIVPMGIPITSQVTMTTRVAVAVSKGLDKFINVKTGIKWVNDIYLDGKKVCGILCEAVNDYSAGILKYAIIGVGVNLTTQNFPEEILASAGSVLRRIITISDIDTVQSKELVNSGSNSVQSLELDNSGADSVQGLELDDSSKDSVSLAVRMDLAQLLATEILSYLAPGGADNFLEEYKERSVILGRDIVFTENGIKQTAHAIDIDSTGGLIVEYEDAESNKSIRRTLSSGEISIREKLAQ